MRGSRHRYRWRRRVAALSGALLLLAVLSVTAFSSDQRHSRSVTRARAAPAVAAAVEHATRPPALGQLTALGRREARAIQRVLRYTPFVVAGSGRRREVALTFDDGPSPYTDPILRILARKHVPATFFIVGQQLNDFARKLHDELRQRIVLGDHTENHAWLVRLAAAGQTSEIDDAARRIKHEGGTFPLLFRPPYGAFNAATRGVLHRLGMLMVLWSVDTGDWRRPGVGAIVSRVLAKSHPGSIVLLHDGGGVRDQTIAALPSIIDGLRRRHYELVTVPRLIVDQPPPRHQRLPHFTGA